MNLVAYTATALSRNDIEDTPTNKNIVDGAIVELKDLDGNLVVIYDDAEGTNPETQKSCNTNGQLTFWAEVGDYILIINGEVNFITIGASVKFTKQSRQAIEAVYKAQGYNSVFFFEDGFTYTESNDVGIYEDGTAWTYANAGALPVTVAAGTVPSEGVYGQVIFNSDLEIIARSLNVKDSAVIYSVDTDTVLDTVKYIYDYESQTTWGVPQLSGAGETIISVNGGLLETSGGSYTLTLSPALVSSGSQVLRALSDRFSDIRHSKDFKDLQSAVDSISSGGVLIVSGTHLISSNLMLSLNNSSIIGDGTAVITGNFDYSLAEIAGDCINSTIDNISFVNTYANQSPDGYSSTLLGRNINVDNLTVKNCKFSIPYANGNGFTLYINTDWEQPPTNYCKDLIIDNCTFYDIGRQGCTLMSRSNQDDPSLFTGVKFTNNKAVSLGLSGDYGMLLSLDGHGSGFVVDNNSCVDTLDIGIENTKWSDGVISRNTFSVGVLNHDFTPIANEGSFVDVYSNKCLTPCNVYSYLVGASYCNYSDNKFWLSSSNNSPYSFLVRSSKNNIFERNTYIIEGGNFCVRYDDSSGTGCSDNVSINDNYISSSSASLDAIRFYGAGTKDNKISKGRYNLSSGGYAGQLEGADANVIDGGGSSGDDLSTQAVTISDSSDSKLDIEAYSANRLQINGTITEIKFLDYPPIFNDVIFTNNTSHRITMRKGGVNRLDIDPGVSVIARSEKSFFYKYT